MNTPAEPSELHQGLRSATPELHQGLRYATPELRQGLRYATPELRQGLRYATPELFCNAGVDIIFSAEPHRCGQPARRVCVIEFAGDPGLIETYCPTHIAALKRDGYKITEA